jgi:hypothetical protein
MDSLIVYSSCVGDPEVVEFIGKEMGDFSPYRTPFNRPGIVRGGLRPVWRLSLHRHLVQHPLRG